MRRSPLRALRRIALAAASIATASAVAPAAGANFDLIHFGHFDRMLQAGDTRGHVRLASLPQSSGHWGLGALAGLKGEVLQHDGRLLVSRGHDDGGRTGAAQEHDEAALFVAAKVQEWVAVVVPSDMTRAAFERFVGEQAQARGLSLDEPFVFLLDGSFPSLVWHVVTGGVPGAGHGGGHGGHANKASGMRTFEQAGSSGRLVGVYSGAQLEGAVSHTGERFHVHFADRDLKVSGHVDAYSVARGATLKLSLR